MKSLMKSLGIALFLSFFLVFCGQKKSGDLTALAKRHVESLVNGDFAGVFTNFDKTMQSALPQDKLQETWVILTGQVGGFKQQIASRTEQIDQYDIVYVTCEFERTRIDIKVVFNKARQIAGLFFLPA